MTINLGFVIFLAEGAASGTGNLAQTREGDWRAAVEAMLVARLSGHLLPDRSDGRGGEEVGLVLRKVEFVSEAFHKVSHSSGQLNTDPRV